MLRVLLVLCALARLGHAERTDHERGAHLAGMVMFGGLYLTIEFPLNPHFAARSCRWCEPPALDRSLRDALAWKRTRGVSLAGDVLGFSATPFVLSALMLAAADDDRGPRRLFDDLAPMVESAIVVSLLQSTLKYTVRRQRPLARYGSPERRWHHDDNHAFWSGHTSAVFAETVAAGLVARERGYRLEPAIWATGLTLGVTTAYLRIAADKHYATDVVVGALVGIATGALVAYMHRDSLQPP